MPGDGVIGEQSQGIGVVACQKILERPDANVTCRNAGEHRAEERSFLAHDLFARGHRGECPGRGNPKRGHGFADDVLAEHRAERRFAIAAAREVRAPGALQLQVVPCAVGVDDLAEQDGAAVAELGRESTELVASVGLCNRLGALGNRIARKRRDALR